MQDENINIISKEFWKEFFAIKDDLYKKLMKKNSFEYNQCINFINGILSKYKIEKNINIQFGIGIRNGIELKERKEYIEMVLSPMFKKNNISILNELYKESKNYDLGKWSVIKYKFFNPNIIKNLTISYDKYGNLEKHDTNPENENIMITKDNFWYYPIMRENKKISILLFLDDDNMEYLAYIKKLKEHSIYIPKNDGIHIILDGAIGEYSLINVIDRIEIHLKSDKEKKFDKLGDIFPIEILNDNIKLVINEPLKNYHKCARCNYSNQNLTMYICKCKKIHYCDKICQKSNWDLHKYNCV